ncbi:hypothetical protein SeMB42_g07206 [Synchytrium endobioticum]|uniref:Protein kinase domain-containing protein n=1 Tax=Synchytrium endobioticum TaxID=286115 RepID=A0A507CC93_9FUNG|nr:hypothetical protein SeMB42_g07206 [Synchytrium endobioticum]
MSGDGSSTAVLWVQLFQRDAEDADDQSVPPKELGSATRLTVLDHRVEDIDGLCKYILNHADFNDGRLNGIKPDQLYAYMDVDCKSIVPADRSIAAITTTYSQPLKIVRPGTILVTASKRVLSVGPLERVKRLQTESIMATQSLSPSQVALNPGAIQSNHDTMLLNHRPLSHFGTPVTFMNPVFYSFQRALLDTDPVPIDDIVELVINGLRMEGSQCCERESEKTAMLNNVFSHLFAYGDKDVNIQVSAPAIAETHTFSDGGLIFVHDGLSHPGLIRQDKLTLGSGGDAHFQVQEYHRQCFLDVEESYRNRTACPCFLITVCASVFLNTTDSDSENSLRRLLYALRTHVVRLYHWYRTLSCHINGKTVTSKSGLLPWLATFLTPSGEPLTIEYDDSFYDKVQSLRNQEYPRHDQHLPSIRRPYMFTASIPFTTENLIVKCAARYSTEAHDFLSKIGKAPKLYAYDSTTILGYNIIVMSHMQRHSTLDMSRRLLTASEYRSLSEAVKQLHSANLVLGDLRPCNVLVHMEEREDVMIIDFDWAGRVGEARYPPGINMNGDIDWPEGVGPGKLITVAHDVTWLERINPRYSPAISMDIDQES